MTTGIPLRDELQHISPSGFPTAECNAKASGGRRDDTTDSIHTGLHSLEVAGRVNISEDVVRVVRLERNDCRLPYRPIDVHLSAVTAIYGSESGTIAFLEVFASIYENHHQEQRTS